MASVSGEEDNVLVGCVVDVTVVVGGGGGEDSVTVADSS
eukprot:CAMPEP_0172486304 /NCGR_PEP_ID=MMETSP1066-20121228/14847_1 /TAXON_ID=671091 /ORGANISM="Coscinodiscus wailesii, Strain CCMP2513" /LENGTH=38 /DNA_ID= /DNA_START= /DNA_END= /DNA_ORIENTATION=